METSQKRRRARKKETKVYKCDTCGKILESAIGYKFHVERHAGKRYECKLCGQSFSHPLNLRNHEMLHSGKRPYKCDICSQEFICARTLKRHIMSHTGERPYKCKICGKGFKEPAKLSRHFNSVHAESKAFKCDICDKSYGDKSSLAVHMKKHADDEAVYKKFMCELCGGRFSTKPVLRRHILTIHNNKSRRPLKYDRKGKKKPIRHHCFMCLKSYAYLWDLKRHEKTHTDRVIYTCVCGSVFDMEKSLKAHMKKCFDRFKAGPQRKRDPNKRLTQILKVKKCIHHKKSGKQLPQEKNTNDSSTDGYEEEEEELLVGGLVLKEETVEGIMNNTIPKENTLITQEGIKNGDYALGVCKLEEDSNVTSDLVLKQEPMRQNISDAIPTHYTTFKQEPTHTKSTKSTLCQCGLDSNGASLEQYVSELVPRSADGKVKSEVLDECLNEFLRCKVEPTPGSGNSVSRGIKGDCSSCLACVAGFEKVYDLEYHYLYDH